MGGGGGGMGRDGKGRLGSLLLAHVIKWIYSKL